MYRLAPLPYAYDALEPYIDARTMELHHDKHQQAYVDNLNAALADYPDLQTLSVKELIMNIPTLAEPLRTAVRNNGGGDINHDFFWPLLKKDAGDPRGTVKDALIKTFGSYDEFKNKFSRAAKSQFGSGWAWLSVNKEGALIVHSTANQDSPLMEGNHPILGLDVWEHAYYLKYQNRRADYIEAWWHIVNWDKVEEHYKHAME